QVVDHFKSASLGSRRKIFLYVDLPEGLAEDAVCRLHAALPAWLDRLRPRERFAAKIKVLVDKFFGEAGRRRIHQVPAQVGFPAIDGSRGQLRVESFKEIRLAN